MSLPLSVWRLRVLRIVRAPGCRDSDTEERWLAVWHLLFYASLVVATVLAEVERSSTAQRIETLILALGLGAWYGVWAVRGWRWLHGNWLPLAIYFAGEMVLIGYLILLHPPFLLITFSIYVQVFSLLPLKPALPIASAITVATYARNSAASGRPLWADTGNLVGAIFSVALMAALAFFIHAIIRRSDERRRLLDEVMATREALAEKEYQAGVLEERQRLSREIHDTLAQGFTSIVMHLEAADQLLPAELTSVRRHVDQARATARESLGEARRLVWALRPEALEGGSLPDALARLAHRYTEETGAECCVHTAGDPFELHPNVEVTLLRVAQEALANVRKHASARRVVITLSYFDDEVMLDVKDDGIGFDPKGHRPLSDNGASGGFGLTAMRERVEKLGGRLLVESAPGDGASVVAALPLAAR